MNADPPSAEPAHLLWRLLALVYDSLPVLALWLLFSAAVVLLHRGPVAPWTLGFWLQAIALWLLTGGYAVASWHRGGQTLGMRPWRLHVVDPQGRAPSIAALWRRYALATLSLAAFGLGFLWSLIDSERRAWHDIGSSTWLLRRTGSR